MLNIESPEGLLGAVGRQAGPSAWITVTQEMIDGFAQLTGDHQWVHVDVERAAREMPGGKTIAHGYLTLSLTSPMLGELLEVHGASRSLNYGSDKVRYLSPVMVDSRIRGNLLIKDVAAAQGGYRSCLQVSVEIEGQAKPALVADLIAFHAS